MDAASLTLALPSALCKPGFGTRCDGALSLPDDDGLGGALSLPDVDGALSLPEDEGLGGAPSLPDDERVHGAVSLPDDDGVAEEGLLLLWVAAGIALLAPASQHIQLDATQ